MTADPSRLRPFPKVDRDNAFFWEGLREHRLLVQRCAACGRHRSPPLPACPDCGASGCVIEASRGGGYLYSWVVVHHAFSEAFEGDVPYTVAVVELDEGCRMLARLELEGGVPAAGMRLEVDFREHGEPSDPTDTATAPEGRWTEAFFRCEEGSA